jgi:fructose PTS system EIIBC or EIIC component
MKTYSLADSPARKLGYSIFNFILIKDYRFVKLPSQKKQNGKQMKICDILRVDKIIPSLKGKEKNEVIDELVNLFKNDPRVKDVDDLRIAVQEREKIMSTGVGKGFGIPHAKTNSVNDIIAAFGKLDEPIDFQALDEQPVNLVFLLVGKENMVGPHIKLLSRISRMMNKDEFRESLAKAKSAQEIYSLFEEEEKQYFENA